jgi:diguanylate cyclase (GGDEF)-like protein/PAS domain S-box-containing protein
MSNRLQLLYAEDSALDADLTRAHFEQVATDFELTIVDTASACLAQLAQRSFDVLMLDNHLPDMDGIDVLTQLRSMGQRLPVVMVTGVGDDETVASALRAGASDYVPKSGQYLNTLPPLLRQLVARQHAQHLGEDDEARREQRILYIEPNAMDAELTQQHFATHAPRLRLSLLTSCREALTVLSQPHGYDLVLTDLRVPGMDALEFLHEARQRQLNIPFVIITGKGDEATAVALLRLGASDYLVKRDNYLMQLPHAAENALHRFRLDQRTSRLQAELQALNASLETKVIERTAELHETQARLRATFDAIPDLIWQKDREGRYQACNPAFRQLADRSSTAVLGSTDADLFDTVTAAALTEQHRCVVASAKPLVREQALQHGARGERVLFEVVSTPMLGSDGTVQGVLGVARDITERKAAQEKIRRLSQIYAALSQCNQAIVHSATESELFNQICLDAVRFGGMKMAWIGLVDPATQAVHAVASFGDGAQTYLHDMRVSADPAQPGGRGPTGSALRLGQAVWCQDFAHDSATAAWRKLGALHGWAASAALPLFRGGVAVGVFNLYAGEVFAFDEATRSLLLEMASDISFALANFERDAARVRAEDALRLTRISVEAASEALFWITPDSRIVDVNEAACRSLGYERDELVTLSVHDVDAEFDPSLWSAHFDELRASGSLTFESAHRTKDGRTFPVEIVANYVKFGDEERNCAFVRDMTAHKATEARIQQLAHFDALTGLPNRVLLNDRISHALSTAQRSNSPLAVLLLDLDHFKNVNDNLGHRIGDNLLIELARRLSAAVREEDTVSRLGGDEFLLLLPGADASAAAHVADKLMDILSQPCQLDEHELVVTPSIGIAMYPADGEDFEALSKCADVAMYRAKQEGRNGFRFFTPEMQARSARALQLENALRQALKREQLALHYQAQMSLSTGRIIGVEALLRWHHPELGMVSPAEFIPIAESSGQIIAIGEWVMRQALGQLRLWLDEGLEPITMAINLSAVQFRLPRLPELVSQILAEAGVPAHLLELELTEGVTMDDAPTAIAVMDDLHARGVTMSIDDFGTGYSSLGHLKRFKIHKLKIDQTFVRDIALDPDDRAIVLAIISLAHSLGIQTIAEGVETQAQLDFLREQGCDEIQGYHLSKPLPAAQSLALIRSHRAG